MATNKIKQFEVGGSGIEILDFGLMINWCWQYFL